MEQKPCSENVFKVLQNDSASTPPSPTSPPRCSHQSRNLHRWKKKKSTMARNKGSLTATKPASHQVRNRTPWWEGGGQTVTLLAQRYAMETLVLRRTLSRLPLLQTRTPKLVLSMPKALVPGGGVCDAGLAAWQQAWCSTNF